MEKLCDVLFELSSAERMNILLSVQKQKLRLSHISKELDITVTEASRHLQRLSKAQLVVKDADGMYNLTPYGCLVLSQLSGLRFASENIRYFLEHDVSFLPYEYVNRIGELSTGKLAADVLTSLRLTELMYQEAEEYAWVLSDQVLASFTPIIQEKIKSDVTFRSIFPDRFVPPPGYTPTQGVERRTVKRVELRVLVTEKEALICFPFMNGKVDYTAFTGKDPKFHKWCRDLYLNYWKKAKPI